MWARHAWIRVCEPSQSLWGIVMNVTKQRGTHWAHFTAASLKHRSGQEAVVRPLVWHKWRHPSHTLVSLWSNGRKRLAWSLARYVQRCNTVCVCARVYQHNKALRPKDCEEICPSAPFLWSLQRPEENFFKFDTNVQFDQRTNWSECAGKRSSCFWK